MRQRYIGLFLFVEVAVAACQPNTAHITDAQSSGKHSVVDTRQATCIKAAAVAHRDYNNGTYTLHSHEFLPVENAYIDVLYLRYGIHWQFVGDDRAGGYYRCYDSIMTELLQQRFGKLFQQKAGRLADSLDATGRWNHAPRFGEGDEELRRFIYSRINWRAAPPIHKDQKKVFISFVIDSLGAVQDVGLLKGIDQKHDAEAVRIMQLMPRWHPKYRQGKPQNTQFTLPIEFSEDKRKAYAR